MLAGGVRRVIAPGKAAGFGVSVFFRRYFSRGWHLFMEHRVSESRQMILDLGRYYFGIKRGSTAKARRAGDYSPGEKNCPPRIAPIGKVRLVFRGPVADRGQVLDT